MKTCFVKYFLFPLVMLTTSFAAFAQDEALSPLRYNRELTKNKKSQRSNQDIYIYEIDTIDLPFLDDFSKDNFKSFDAQPGDPNVTLQQFFQLYDSAGTTLLPATAAYMRTQTYFITYDTTGGSVTQTLVPLDSVYITINNLSAYPVVSQIDSVWPPYNIVDTAWLPSSPDTIWTIPDVVQDSVNVYFVSAAGDASIWQDRFVYRNNRYPIGPPSLGVATFDGLDENGYPYDFLNITLIDVADYLTSKPINLGTKPVSGTYSAADSIYFSFYYQSTGRGNEPNPGDSLILEFWAPDSAQWYHVWATDGMALNDFQQVMIPIRSFYFLKDGFKFRFKNIGHLCGSLDHWHVDYVYLNSARTQADTIKQDVAFIYDKLSLLKDYSQMPWNHFMWDPSGYMADTMTVYQKNNDNANRIIANQQIEAEYQGIPQGTINGPIIPNVNPDTFFSTLFDIDAAGFVYDTSLADTSALFKVKISYSPGSNYQQNDTIYFDQVFENCYAYDDGTAEAAYGPQASNAKLAYKFHLPQADTLRAIRIHFEPDVYNVTSHPFFLSVWDATGPGGVPGNLIIENSTFHFPVYVDANNGFYEYPLDNKVVVSGYYYIGWRQLDQDKLNIGFDFNTDAYDKIYFRTGSNWLNTSYHGALMMRPVFAYGKDYIQSLNENDQETTVKIYPNPANETLNIQTDLQNFTVEIFDISGRFIRSAQMMGSNTLAVGELNNGIYLLRLRNTEGQLLQAQKLIIQH